MKWHLAIVAFTLLLVATPAIGSFHTSLQNSLPDRVFLLTMSGTSFNGLHAPNTPLLEAYRGERVRFAVLASEAHTFHVHGHPWLLETGEIVDTFIVNVDRPHVFDVPAGGADGNAGDWLYHCHFNAHVSAGMWGIFRVYPYRATILPSMTLALDALGEPVDGARVSLAVDGVDLPAHVEPLGHGRYQIHAVFPETGALVVTSEHASLGTSVARMSLGGGETPMPTVALAGTEHSHGHAS